MALDLFSHERSLGQAALEAVAEGYDLSGEWVCCQLCELIGVELPVILRSFRGAPPRETPDLLDPDLLER